MTTYDISTCVGLALAGPIAPGGLAKIPGVTEAEARAMVERYSKGLGEARAAHEDAMSRRHAEEPTNAIGYRTIALHPTQFRDLQADMLVTRNPDGLDLYKVTGPASPPKVQPLRFVHGLALAGWAS